MSEYHVAFWNVENLFDVEDSPRRSEKLERTLAGELEEVCDIQDQIEEVEDALVVLNEELVALQEMIEEEMEACEESEEEGEEDRWDVIMADSDDPERIVSEIEEHLQRVEELLDQLTEAENKVQDVVDKRLPTW